MGAIPLYGSSKASLSTEARLLQLDHFLRQQATASNHAGSDGINHGDPARIMTAA